MKKEKDKVYKVEIKPKWELNFAAKFYLVCIIVFVLLVAYIQIYRHIHRDEIIQNIIERENKVVVENEIKLKIIEHFLMEVKNEIKKNS